MNEREGDVRLGILVQRWPSDDRPFGPMTSFVQTVTALARRERVAVSAFDPADLDLGQRRVEARRYLGAQKGWTMETTPLPDVIWNRYLKRDQAKLLSAMREKGLLVLNRASLDKWAAYQALKAEPALQPHLPETQRLGSARVASEMLERHGLIFIKPVDGAVGRGIIRGRLDPNGLFRLQYISLETLALREEFVTPRQLDRWLERHDRTQRYIAQQGIALAKIQGRPADVRVLVQKDGGGKWQVTGMGVRVAAPGRFTTNLHTGGQGLPIQTLAEVLWPGEPERGEELVAHMQYLSLATARVIDQAADGMGELGLDFGVDGNGQIWFIEQNAQPGRSIFEHIGRRDLSDLAHLRPVQCARHLASQRTARTEST